MKFKHCEFCLNIFDEDYFELTETVYETISFKLCDNCSKKNIIEKVIEIKKFLNEQLKENKKKTISIESLQIENYSICFSKKNNSLIKDQVI